MKKLIFVLMGAVSFNTFAVDPTQGPLQQDPSLCSYGYNSNCNSNNSLNKRTIIHYREIKIPPKYGALALDENTGAIGDAIMADSLAQAKKAAIRQCNSKGCKVVGWVKNGCIAAAGGKLGKRWKLVNAAEERGDAERVAMNRCKKAGVSDCQIVVPEGCSIPDTSQY